MFFFADFPGVSFILMITRIHFYLKHQFYSCFMTFFGNRLNKRTKIATPWKISMEPTKSPMKRKENDLPTNPPGNYVHSMLIFRSVFPIPNVTRNCQAQETLPWWPVNPSGESSRITPLDGVFVVRSTGLVVTSTATLVLRHLMCFFFCQGLDWKIS